MLTRGDLVDIILEHLARRDPPGRAAPAPGAQASRREAPDLPVRARAPVEAAPFRLFLSEYDVKRRLTPHSQQLKIPKGAILSPLAIDWLVLKGIDIVRE